MRLLNDRYEVLDVVGRGGEGTVLRALDRRHHRLVALKRRRLPLDDGEAERFMLEARTLLSMPPHPGLPLARDDFFDDDHHYLVLDWIEGIDLASFVAEHGRPGLPVATVLRWLASVARTLTHLHQSTPLIVHGDVKPANLILTTMGDIALVDFGMSSTPGGRGRGGTPGFRAPDAMTTALPTRAVDVYGLAATAFALLTGAPPIGVLPDWGTLDPERAHRLEAAIRRGMATDPARRTATPGEFVEELRAGWDVLPVATGILTYMSTDVVITGRSWQEHPHEGIALRADHAIVVDAVLDHHGGRQLDGTTSEGVVTAIFERAGDAVEAAIELQRAAASRSIPVRCALDTGEAALDGRHVGATHARVGRIREIADSGQVLLTSVTALLAAAELGAGCDTVELGAHRIVGFDQPVMLFAIDTAGIAVPTDPGVSPYPGLISFQPQDRDLFFGRDDVVSDVIDRTGHSALVGVVGASGSGKSSLLRAGVAPRLAGAVVITPTEHPMEAIASIDTDTPLVVDQLEELFTLCTDPVEAAAFVEALIGRAAPRVVAVRADMYGWLANHPELANAVAANHVLLGPMTRDQLRAAIEGPARARGFELEAGLVELALTDVGLEPGVLPHLAHALRETWLRRDGRTLTVAGYGAAGGVRGALTQTAEALHHASNDDDRHLLGSVMLQMVEVGDGLGVTRRKVALADLRARHPGRDIGSLVTRLAAARLVTLDAESVEPAHEALLRDWPRLREWIDEARGDLRFQRMLSAASAEWARRARDPADLFRGSKLATAVDWLGAHADHVSALEVEFIDASRRLERDELFAARRTTRRLRGLVSGLAVLVVVALGATAIALVQRNHADDAANRAATLADEADVAADVAQQGRVEAQTSRLVAESRSTLDRDLSLAMLLAVEAHRRADTPATRGALLSSLTHNVSSVRAAQGTAGAEPGVPHVKSSFIGFVAGPARQTTSMSVSGDGHIVVTAGLRDFGVDVGSAMIFDTIRRSLIGTIATSRPPSVSVSPDGTRVLVTDDHQVRLFDVATRATTELSIPRNSSEFIVATFTPDGLRFMVSTTDHRLRLFDTSTMNEIDVDLPESPDNLASIEADGSLRIGHIAPPALTFWDLDTNRELRTVSLEYPPTLVNNFAHSGDGARLAAFAYQGPMVVWELTGGQLSGAPEMRPQSVRAGAFDPSNPAIMAIGSADGSVTMYDVVAERSVGQPLRGMLGGVRALAFSADGQLLVTTGDDGALALWGDNGGPSLLSSPIGDGERLLDASETGEVLVVGGPRYAKIVRPAKPGTTTRIDLDALLPEASESQPAVWMLTPDGSKLLGGLVSSRSTRLWLFDTGTGAVLWTHAEAGSSYISDVSSDGARVAMSTGDMVTILESRTDVPIASFTIDQAIPDTAAFFTGPPLFNTDSSKVSIATNVGVVRFDIASGTMTHGDVGGFVQGWVSQIAGTDDLVVAGLGGRLWRLDMTTGQVVTSGRSVGGTSLVRGTVSADGSLVAAAHPFASSIALMDGETLVPIGEPVPAGNVDDFSPIVVSPDGTNVYANGPMNTAIEWNLDTTTWESVACRAAGRNLTASEWADYIGEDTPYHATCDQWPLGN